MAESDETSRQSEDERWLALMIRRRRNDDESKSELKSIIMNVLKRPQEDFLYFTERQNSALSWYFFVREREDTDLMRIYEVAKDFLESFDSHSKITGEECRKMFGNAKVVGEEKIGFGDIVRIERGKYRKLFGIVVRDKRGGFFEVGLKFCYGIEMEVFSRSDLKVFGNVFDYVKCQ